MVAQGGLRHTSSPNSTPSLKFSELLNHVVGMFTMVARYIHHSFLPPFPWPGKKQVFPILSAQFSVFLTLRDLLCLLYTADDNNCSGVTSATAFGDAAAGGHYWTCRWTGTKLTTLGVHRTWQKVLEVAIWWTLNRSTLSVLVVHKPFPHALCAATQWIRPGNLPGWKTPQTAFPQTAVLPSSFYQGSSPAISSRRALF